MPNLATNLAENLATNLARDLAAGAAGTWRDDYPTLADYWPTINNDGDVLVADNLDSWVGRIAGWTCAAPSAPQRPTPPQWTFTSANSTRLDFDDAALLALFEGNAPWTVMMRVPAATPGSQFHWNVQAANLANSVRFLTVSGGSNLLLRRSVGGSNADINVAAGAATTVGGTYDGSTLTLFLDGVSVGSIASAGSMPTLSVGEVGILDARFQEIDIAGSALSPAQMADIHTNLMTDYP